MKIGLLGGSFNPIHFGHLTLAEKAKEKLALDKIWLVPTGNHPFKAKEKLLSLEKRVKLIKSVVKDHPFLEICYLDAEENKPNFTDQLLKKLFHLYPENEFLFLAGEDILAELPRWHNSKWLIKNVDFVIFTRLNNKEKKYEKFLDKENVRFIQMQPIFISSTEIRNRIKENRSIENLVPKSIQNLIISYYK